VSRIAALFHRDGRPVDAHVLGALISAVRNPNTTHPDIRIERSVGIAQLEAATSDHIALAERIVFDGRLDNRRELGGSLAIDDPASETMSDASLADACYRRFGETFVSRLNGDFSFALWDESKLQLVLARDLIGVRPLYYWSSDKMFIAASEIKSILAHPEVSIEPDEEGLADALLGGNPHDVRRTCFRNVFRVVPGTTIVAGRDRVVEFRHRDFILDRPIRCGSVSEYADGLRRVFEQAVRRRVRPSTGNVGVLVSGGLDSSAILCQALRLKEHGEPVASTVGVSWVFPNGGPADEMNALDDIENQHRIGIHRLPFHSLRLLDEQQWVRTSEFPRVRWDSEVVGLSVLRERGCASVLDGYFGDQMMTSDAPLFDAASSFRLFQVRREFNALAASMLDCIPRILLQEFLHYYLWEIAPERALRVWRAMRRLLGRDRSPRWYSREFRDTAHRRSQQQHRPAAPFSDKHSELCYRHFVPTHRLNVLEELNKLSWAHGLDRAYPFMDRDLVDFILAIPGTVVNADGIYKGLFREAMRGILPDPIRERRWKADFTGVGDDAESDGRSRFADHFTRGCLGAEWGLVDNAILRTHLGGRTSGEVAAPIRRPYGELSAVVALELWLRAFMRSDSHVEATQLRHSAT
jgi:asparagine synthase (glutamine-hydrolysing)